MIIDYKLAVVTPQRGKGGVIAEEAVIFAKWLEEAGVDMLHVAQANHTGNMADTIPPMGSSAICILCLTLQENERTGQYSSLALLERIVKSGACREYPGKWKGRYYRTG